MEAQWLWLLAQLHSFLRAACCVSSSARLAREQLSGLNLPPFLLLPRQKKKKQHTTNRLMLLSRGFMRAKGLGKAASCNLGSAGAALGSPAYLSMHGPPSSPRAAFSFGTDVCSWGQQLVPAG